MSECVECRAAGGLILPQGQDPKQGPLSLPGQPAMGPEFTNRPLCSWHNDLDVYDGYVQAIQAGDIDPPPLLTIPRILGGGTLRREDAGMPTSESPWCAECYGSAKVFDEGRAMRCSACNGSGKGTR